MSVNIGVSIICVVVMMVEVGKAMDWAVLLSSHEEVFIGFDLYGGSIVRRRNFCPLLQSGVSLVNFDGRRSDSGGP